MADKTTLHLAEVADIHFDKTSSGILNPLFASVAKNAGVLLLYGDIIDYRQPDTQGTVKLWAAAIYLRKAIIGVL